VTVKSLQEALDLAEEKKLDAYIAGGGGIYKEAMSGQYQIDRVLKTQIELYVAGDTFFPELDPSWVLVSKDFHHKDEKNKFDYSFQIYERKKLQ